MAVDEGIERVDVATGRPAHELALVECDMGVGVTLPGTVIPFFLDLVLDLERSKVVSATMLCSRWLDRRMLKALTLSFHVWRRAFNGGSRPFRAASRQVVDIVHRHPSL